MNNTSIEYFKNNKYIHVQNVISDQFASIASLYALFNNEKHNKINNENNFDTYGDFLTESILAHMVPLIKEHTGIEVEPTYSYYKIYNNINDLMLIDPKESSEISAAICIGYNYADSKYGAWGISVNNERIKIKPKDMLIFRPHDLQVSRPKFYIKGEFYEVYVVLSYIEKYGKNKNLIYDKREFLGT